MANTKPIGEMPKEQLKILASLEHKDKIPSDISRDVYPDYDTASEEVRKGYKKATASNIATLRRLNLVGDTEVRTKLPGDTYEQPIGGHYLTPKGARTLLRSRGKNPEALEQQFARDLVEDTARKTWEQMAAEKPEEAVAADLPKALKVSVRSRLVKQGILHHATQPLGDASGTHATIYPLTKKGGDAAIRLRGQDPATEKEKYAHTFLRASAGKTRDELAATRLQKTLPSDLPEITQLCVRSDLESDGLIKKTEHEIPGKDNRHAFIYPLTPKGERLVASWPPAPDAETPSNKDAPATSEPLRIGNVQRNDARPA
jgi:hypothetical protein